MENNRFHRRDKAKRFGIVEANKRQLSKQEIKRALDEQVQENVARKRDERRRELASEERHVENLDAEFFPNEPPSEPAKPYDYEKALAVGNQYLSPDELRADLDRQVEDKKKRSKDARRKTLREERAHIVGLEDQFHDRKDRRRSKQSLVMQMSPVQAHISYTIPYACMLYCRCFVTNTDPITWLSFDRRRPLIQSQPCLCRGLIL